MEILGLIFGGVSCSVAVLTKLVGAMRNYDRQVQALREEMATDRLNAEQQRSDIRADLIAIKSWMNIQSSIASSPRHLSRSAPIE